MKNSFSQPNTILEKKFLIRKLQGCLEMEAGVLYKVKDIIIFVSFYASASFSSLVAISFSVFVVLKITSGYQPS